MRWRACNDFYPSPFIADKSIFVGESDGGTHNPLYDSAAAAAVYRFLVKEA